MSENKPDLMAELAACPFCGGEAELFEGYGAFVVCAECEVEGPYKAFKDDAIAAWNRRTHHAELEAVVRFHAFFADKCEGLYHEFGGDAIDLYNAAAKAMHNSAREG